MRIALYAEKHAGYPKIGYIPKQDISLGTGTEKASKTGLWHIRRGPQAGGRGVTKSIEIFRGATYSATLNYDCITFRTKGENMESIQVTCPGCKKKINASRTHFGKTVRCPQCQNFLRIPNPKSEIKEATVVPVFLSSSKNAIETNSDVKEASAVGQSSQIGNEPKRQSNNEEIDREKVSGCGCLIVLALLLGGLSMFSRGDSDGIFLIAVGFVLLVFLKMVIEWEGTLGCVVGAFFMFIGLGMFGQDIGTAIFLILASIVVLIPAGESHTANLRRRFSAAIIKSIVILLLAGVGSSYKGKWVNSTEKPSVSYSIIKEETFHDYKRSIDVRLSGKVSRKELKKIAYELKRQGNTHYDRTFIVYYLPGMKVNAGGWATSHFNPDLEIKILGNRFKE